MFAVCNFNALSVKIDIPLQSLIMLIGYFVFLFETVQRSHFKLLKG